ncbi:chromosomal organization and DNA repair protein Mms21 [Paecilomyces variotii No. 5]|uniref:peptidylprolyl isomerase n=1 Tax=Byssochlamys spectabilis (strain No. 5 / NBRC 109023) TaxID=1356009 RepID=V5FIF7_BYSSN|nr:chromosomal organization and DNA repair protein Mms21 [Paecilomyces variotii No. 5]
MLSATPESSSRRERHRDSQRAQSSRVPTMPEYQPLSAPLNPKGQRALAALLQSQSFRHLNGHLQHASEKLTDTAGEVNDRLTEAQRGYQRRQQRKMEARAAREDQDDTNPDQEEEEDEEAQKLAEKEEKVKEITARLEEKMREVVDAEVKLEGLTNVLGDLAREAEAAEAANAIRTRTRRGARRRNPDEMDEDDEDDEDYEASPERETGEGDKPPSQQLQDKLAENTEKWEGLSLTQRYTNNNDYVGFYRIVHDAKHPGDDIPPPPHPSTWFSHLEDPNAVARGISSPARRTRRARNRSASPAGSEDIAIERERISLKCPLTLLTFRDPVTSAKCPHSFERQAIEDMIAHSSTTEAVPSRDGSRPRRVRSVKCPVCSVSLTLQDLRPDAVLLRRVRRAEREAESEDESDDDEAERRRRKGGRKSGFTVASSDVGDDDEMEVDSDRRAARVKTEETVRVKQERARQSVLLSED